MNNKNLELVAQQQLEFVRILELSDLMLTRAQEEQWESVTELQFQREELIQQFFAKDLVIDMSKIGAGIQYIIASDKKLEDLGRAERNSLQQQINKIKQGKTAIKAYSTE